MKKILPALLAVVLAMGFSAFTTAKHATDTLWYFDDVSQNYVEVPSGVNPCDPGTKVQCIRQINGEDHLLFIDQLGNPYMAKNQ